VEPLEGLFEEALRIIEEDKTRTWTPKEQRLFIAERVRAAYQRNMDERRRSKPS
jgi:hypothetical protein